jgi:hypothetical protein
MHRTNLYLTEDQERALDARARSARVSRSAIVREILDRELSLPSSLDETTQAALASLAEIYLDEVEGMFDDDPDLRIPR